MNNNNNNDTSCSGPSCSETDSIGSLDLLIKGLLDLRFPREWTRPAEVSSCLLIAPLCVCVAVGGGAGEQKKPSGGNFITLHLKLLTASVFFFFFPLPRSPFPILSASDSLCRDGAAGVAEKRLDSPAAEAC